MEAINRRIGINSSIILMTQFSINNVMSTEAAEIH